MEDKHSERTQQTLLMSEHRRMFPKRGRFTEVTVFADVCTRSLMLLALIISVLLNPSQMNIPQIFWGVAAQVIRFVFRLDAQQNVVSKQVLGRQCLTFVYLVRNYHIKKF